MIIWRLFFVVLSGHLLHGKWYNIRRQSIGDGKRKGIGQSEREVFDCIPHGAKRCRLWFSGRRTRRDADLEGTGGRRCATEDSVISFAAVRADVIVFAAL